MADVFLCKTGALTAPSRNALKKSGVVVVEVDNPADCQFIRASELVTGDDMLFAAFRALKATGDTYNKGVHQREQFAVSMGELIEAAWTARRARAE